MFENATHRFIEGEGGVPIHTVVMGKGAPLLLLHGHPETYLMWHKVADDLAQRFTLVMCDLRGYGDSGKPDGRPDHSTYSKRVMALDCIKIMSTLGYSTFSVIGHDRGARVAYRMALDHPEVVDKLVLLDIVSTYDMYALSSAEFAKALFHSAMHCILVGTTPKTTHRRRHFRKRCTTSTCVITTWSAFMPFARNTALGKA